MIYYLPGHASSPPPCGQRGLAQPGLLGSATPAEPLLVEKVTKTKKEFPNRTQPTAEQEAALAEVTAW